MEVFEIHITGQDEAILAEAANLSLKTISIDLLKPDGSPLRTEHMTSHVMKTLNYETCKYEVDAIVAHLEQKGVRLLRVKIECPYYKHYESRSLYMESHFSTEDFTLPVSQNKRKTTYLGTDREYNHDSYQQFAERYAGKELELCLHDTNVDEDKDWFSLYEEQQC